MTAAVHGNLEAALAGTPVVKKAPLGGRSAWEAAQDGPLTAQGQGGGRRSISNQVGQRGPSAAGAFTGFELAELRRLVEAESKDKSRLRFAEFEVVLHRLMCLDDSAASRVMAEELFTRFDKDRNGAVGWPELLSGLAALSRGSALDRLELAFDIFDTDGDGFISITELRRCLGALAQPPVDWGRVNTLCDEVMYYADTNVDGRLSWAEFRTSTACEAVLGWIEALSSAMSARLARGAQVPREVELPQRTGGWGSVKGGDFVATGEAKMYGRKYGTPGAGLSMFRIPHRNV